MLFGDTRNEDHTEPNGKNYNRRTKIRLEKNQGKKHKSVKTRNQNMPHISDFHMPSRKILRQKNHQKKFYKVHWLESESAKIKPTSRSLNRRHHKESQKKQTRGQESPGNHPRPTQKSPIYTTGYEKRQKRERQPNNLFIKKLTPPDPSPTRQKRIHSDNPSQRNKKGRADQKPIH